MPSIRSPGSRVIGRQLALGFGLVSIVAVAMCGLLLVLLGRVGGLVDHMRHDEHAIRLGGQLSTAVREQYMHLTTAVVEDDVGAAETLAMWTMAVHGHLVALGPRVPDAERWRIEALEAHSAEMDVIFRTRIAPAMAAGDREAVRRAHEAVEASALIAAAHADVIAEAVEGRMAGAHVTATAVTRFGMISGLACVVLVLALAVGYTVRLRRSVLAPLGRLTRAARSIGSGELHARLGAIGRGELQEVATAFDHMAEELVARERRLLHSERMAAIGQLAAGVAHEMNNPIGIIRGYLKTMRPDEDPDVLGEELRILDEEAAACQRIADDLLAYARTPELQVESVTMRPFLDEAVRRLGETGELGEAPVTVDAEPGRIDADPWRLRQVIANLTLNAVQVSTGSEPVDVIGRPGADGGYVIEIRDRGPGVSTSERERIFEPFFSKRPGGSGLGLAVCQGIVIAHGGRIEALPRTGGGTILRVALPARPPAVRGDAA